jgi:hypothetical protein
MFVKAGPSRMGSTVYVRGRLIIPTTSPFNRLIWLPFRPGKDARHFTVDYCKLNAMTGPPRPRIANIEIIYSFHLISK